MMNDAAAADLSAHFAAFCAANPAEGRRIFEQAIAKSATPAEADDRRLLCEYFCNPEEAAALYATEARLRASNAPDKVLEYIQQAAMWLEDGPCEDCGSYHECWASSTPEVGRPG